jgi:curved DNA-binding protein CbpA
VNYYELLSIARDANANEIKRAYFSAVKLHSPDSDPEGFKSIRIAYETLYDQKKRAEYDAYFVSSGETQNDLLIAHELIRKNEYKQAVEFLTELSKKNPDTADVNRLLAEVLWYMKKSGAADKICGELLEKNPSDCDTLLLRAKIAASQGYRKKANVYFNDAVSVAPLNPKAWIEYMRYSMTKAPWQTSKIFYRAMEQDIDMFRDEYFFYIVGAYETNLFNNENHLQYYEKFAEYFTNDKNPNEETYSYIMLLMPRFIENEELVPFVEKILPSLENSKQYRDKNEKDFKYIKAVIVMHKLRSDKRIHDVLVDLTGFLLEEDENKNEQLSMENYIVFNLSLLRPSIKVLMNEYPEYFKLNKAFYLDALNEKKNDYLIDKYIAVQKKLKYSARNTPGDAISYDDHEETEVEIPFRRKSPKIGRNDPCPCGSGKKHKKCCGKDLPVT